MEIIIEEISRGHKLISRHKFATEQVNIGRGYDNDIVITDPHVCADHLQLQFDGERWSITDQGSINGSFLEGNKENIIHHQVQSGDVITLGKSQIRLVFPHHPVEQSISISPFEDLINLAKHPLVLALTIATFTIIAGWMANLNQTTEVTLVQKLVPAIAIVLGFTLWPIGVALVSYLTKHEARFWTQIGITFIFFNLMWLSDMLESIIHFNTASNFSFFWLVAVIPLLLSFSLFWLNCYVGFHMTNKRRCLVSAGLVALLFGGSFVVQMSKQPDFNPRPSFDTTIMSPSFLFAPSSTVETFVNESNTLFEQATKAAIEEK